MAHDADHLLGEQRPVFGQFVLSRLLRLVAQDSDELDQGSLSVEEALSRRHDGALHPVDTIQSVTALVPVEPPVQCARKRFLFLFTVMRCDGAGIHHIRDGTWCVEPQQACGIVLVASAPGRDIDLPQVQGAAAQSLPQPCLAERQLFLRAPFLQHQFVCPLARSDQLALVLVALFGNRDRDFVVAAGLADATNRVQHHRNSSAVLVTHFELDLGQRPLHLQRRQPVRLVEDPPAHGEELLQALEPDQFI